MVDSVKGFIADGIHNLFVRIYYQDTDAGGIVYHSKYLDFCERGRGEALRCLSLELEPNLLLKGKLVKTFFVLVHSDISYKSPARLHDILRIETSIADYSRVSVTFSQNIYCYESSKLLVSVKNKLVLIDNDGNLVRIPNDYIEKIKTELVYFRS